MHAICFVIIVVYNMLSRPCWNCNGEYSGSEQLAHENSVILSEELSLSRGHHKLEMAKDGLFLIKLEILVPDK